MVPLTKANGISSAAVIQNRRQWSPPRQRLFPPSVVTDNQRLFGSITPDVGTHKLGETRGDASTPWLVIGSVCCFVSSAISAPFTPLERQECRNDYRQFCSDYGLDTPALRTCMNKHGHSLSHGCIDALIDAGEVTRAEVERRKRGGE